MLESGLVIRRLTAPAEHRAAEALLAGVWRAAPGHSPISADVLRALAFVGGYVAGAFLPGTGSEAMIGASAGFLGGDLVDLAARPYLHSHITGVTAQARGRQVGYALKLDQREWALQRGLTTINWTFDPLVRRNAFFNLSRVGAEATRYLIDFYGDMADAVNLGQGSDRLLVQWWLDREPAEPVEEPPRGEVLLDIAPDGGPRVSASPGEGPLLCRVPEDIEALRLANPDLARAWRPALRDTLGAAMAAGHRISGVTRSGWYVLAAR